MVDAPKTLAARIVLARGAMGLSQEALARRVGIRQPSIFMLEAGETKGTKHIVDIARVLGQSAEWLQNGEGEFQRPSVAFIDNVATRKKLKKLLRQAIELIDHL